jgi:drug/metabolite transporter (DMT)-like permease
MRQENTGQSFSGIFFFVAAILLISIVDTVCKVFTVDLHSLQLVWGYFLGINLTLWVFFLIRREPVEKLFETDRLIIQLMRPAFLAGSITCLFLGLTYLPIAEATAIGFTAPLFITALSVPILGEKVGLHRWTAVFIGLLGMIIIIRPGGGLWHWASIMPFLGAVFFAVFQIITRLLSTTEKTNTTLFYTGVGGLLWTSILVPFVWVTPSPIHWLVFLLTGMMGAVAHLCMISAFNRAEASLLAPYNYTKLLWVSVLGYLVFDDIPSLNMWLGAAVIVASGIYVLYRERKA